MAEQEFAGPRLKQMVICLTTGHLSLIMLGKILNSPYILVSNILWGRGAMSGPRKVFIFFFSRVHRGCQITGSGEVQPYVDAWVVL